MYPFRSSSMPFALAAQSYRTLDFGVNLSGFLGARVTARKPTRLFATFDEILSDGDVNWRRLSCVNIVAWELAPGTHTLQSFEPYTLRYLKLICVEGACQVEGVYLREYAHPPVQAQFTSSDERLNRIFAAGVENGAHGCYLR